MRPALDNLPFFLFFFLFNELQSSLLRQPVNYKNDRRAKNEEEEQEKDRRRRKGKKRQIRPTVSLARF